MKSAKSMSALKSPSSIGEPGRFGIWTRLRFNPQVLALIVVALTVFFPLREAIGAFVWWHYRDTYQRLDFVVTETPTEPGVAWGRLVAIGADADAAGEDWVLGTIARDGQIVLDDAPAIAATPGARVQVLWSPSAPGIGYGNGRATNIALTSERSSPPGPLPFLSWLALTGVLGWVGGKLFLWSAGYRREIRTALLLDE